MRWRRRHTHDDDTSALCEAEWYLSGRLLELQFFTGAEPPAWVWLSMLAHGDEATVADAQAWLRTYGGKRPELDAWGRVLQMLARKVQDTLDRAGCPLIDLQRSVLLPLEESVAALNIGPMTLYRVVGTTLSQVEPGLRA